MNHFAFRIPIRMFLRGGLCLVVLLAADRSGAGTPVSSTVPAWDPIYRELRLAENLGLLQGSSMGSRPLTRAELFRLFSPLADTLGARGETEFAPIPEDSRRGVTFSVSRRLTAARDWIAPGGVGTEEGNYPTTLALEPLNRVSLGLSAIDSTRRGPHDLGLGYDRTEGLQLEGDANFFLEHDWVALTATFRVRADGDAVTLRPLVLNARLGWRNLRLTLGREPLAWGPGMRGGILLSTHARPMDQLRLESEHPWRLPFFLRDLGTWHASAFVTQLDDPGRGDYPNPWITGMRLNWSPWSWLVLGAHRTILLGGEGNEYDLNWHSFWDLIFGRNENRSTGDLLSNNTDQRGGVEGSLYLWPLFRGIPLLDGGRLYGELDGEDSPQNGVVPSARAGIVGLELVASGTTLRFELADIADDTARWYYHFIYTDGYTYRGRILGHPAGTDVRTLALEMETSLGKSGFLELGWEVRSHGIFAQPGQSPRWSVPPIPNAKRHLFHLGLEKNLGDYPGRLRLELRAQITEGDPGVLTPYEDYGFTLAWWN